MSAPNVDNLPEPPDDESRNGEVPERAPDKQERPAAATRLVELAQRGYSLGVTPEGEPFATSRGTRTHIALPLRGGRLGLRHALFRDFYEAEGRAASQQAASDALATLHGIAQDLDPTELHLRVAEADGVIYVDTGDAAGTVLRITAQGWEATQGAPVTFRRTELTGAYVTPSRGGQVSDLFQFLNVAEHDRPLLLAFLVSTYLPNMPHPVLTLAGEQGTGKSTATRLLVDLTDPSPVPLRKPPRDADGLVTAFAGSWVAALDNLSTVSDWLSDSLCRAVTGEGDVRRQLYTDGGLSVFAFRRVVILTGIDFAGLRGDLSERMLLVQLERITDGHRVDEQSLLDRWRAALPGILGALLDLLVLVLQELPAVRLESSPRMADFARVLAAVDRVLGGDGFARYSAQSAELAADTLTASPFTERLLRVSLDELTTASALLDKVTPTDPAWKVPRGWPKSAREVTTVLKRDAPALRKQGWIVEPGGEDRSHSKLWRVVSADRADALGSGVPHSGVTHGGRARRC